MAAHVRPDGGDAQGNQGSPPFREGTLIEAVDVPSMCFYLPQSCYGSTLMLPLVVPMSDWPKWSEFALTQYILLLMNLVVQTVFLYSTYGLAVDAVEQSMADDCDVLSAHVLVVSVWAFICTVLTDLQETGDLLEIVLRQLPTTLQTEVLTWTKAESGEIALSGGGVSKRWKAFILVCLVLPKIAFAIVLLVVGCSFLVHSENDADILLNCFALVFILQIDELIFFFLSPPKSRRYLEAVPPFIVKGAAPAPWSWWGEVSQPAKLLLSAGLTVLAIVSQNRCGWESPGGDANPMHYMKDYTTMTTTMQLQSVVCPPASR